MRCLGVCRVALYGAGYDSVLDLFVYYSDMHSKFSDVTRLIGLIAIVDSG